MSKTWVVWYDITYRVEVEAPDQDTARELAQDGVLLDENMVHCVVTPELLEDDGVDPVLEVEEAWERSFDDA